MKKKQKVQIFKLEERVLFDGAAAAEIVAAVNNAGNAENADQNADDSEQGKEEKFVQNTVQNAGPVDTPAPEANVQNAGDGLPQADAAQNDPAEVLIQGHADFAQVTDPDAGFSGDVADFIQAAAAPDAEASSQELIVIDSEAADQFDAEAFEGKNVLLLNGDSEAADQIEDWMNEHSDQNIESVRLVTDSDTLASQISDLDVELVSVDAFQAELSDPDSSDLVIVPDHEASFTVDSLTESLPEDLTAEPGADRHELVILNSTTADLDNVLEQLGDSRDILVIDANSDAFEQISEYLDHSDTSYDAVHILTHGNDEGFYLGSQKVIAADQMTVFDGHMADNADFMLYGCNLASTEHGQALIHNIADLTGCDVAASSDITGAAAVGGNWTLEYNSGAIETASITLDSSWGNRLADITISDDPETATNYNSWANYIAATPGNDTVTFQKADTISGLTGLNITIMSGGNAISGDYNINGGSLTLIGTNFSVSVSGTGNFTLGNGTDETGSTGAVSTSGAVVINSKATNSGSITNASSVTLNSGGTNSGTIASNGNVTISGTNTGSITKSGSVTLNNGAANNAFDVTSSGAIEISNASKLSGKIVSSSTLTVEAGSQLDLGADSTLAGTVTNNGTITGSVTTETLTLSGTNTGLWGTSQGGTFSLTSSKGTTTINGSANFNNATLTFSGTANLSAGGTGTFTKSTITHSGSGNMTFNAAGIYTDTPVTHSGSGTLTISAGTFKFSQASSGTLVTVSGAAKLDISNGTFSGTQKTGTGVDASSGTGSFNISGGTFKSLATGVTVSRSSNARINGGTFTGNTYGVNNSGNLTVSGGTFTSNINSNNSAGAGILNSANATLTMTTGSPSFTGNYHGVQNAGTINGMSVGNIKNSVDSGLYNTGTITRIANVTFTNNGKRLVNGSYVTEGGAIYNSGTISRAEGLTIDGANTNHVSMGGGIYNSGTITNLIESEIRNSTARNGGGVYNSGTITILDSYIHDNQAKDGNGGGVYNTQSGKATIISTPKNNGTRWGTGDEHSNSMVISNNTASGTSNGTTAASAGFGGGIYADSGSTLTLNSVTITGNKASLEVTADGGPYDIGRGGGIYFGEESVIKAPALGNGKLTIDGTVHDMNYDSSVTAEMSDPERASEISGNTAALGAGLFLNTKGTVTVNHTEIYGNKVPANVLSPVGDLEKAEDIFAKLWVYSSVQGDYPSPEVKTAGGELFTSRGVGIYVSGSGNTVTLNDVSIYENDGKDESAGGGLYVTANPFDSSATVTVKVVASDIHENTASQGGGAYLNSGTLTLTNDNLLEEVSRIHKNTAESGGGIYQKGGTLNVWYQAIYNNTVKNGTGLAIYQAGGEANLNNVTIANHSSSDSNAAAIYLYDGKMDVYNTTVGLNKTIGIKVNYGTLKLYNALVVGNGSNGNQNVVGDYKSEASLVGTYSASEIFDSKGFDEDTGVIRLKSGDNPARTMGGLYADPDGTYLDQQGNKRTKLPGGDVYTVGALVGNGTPPIPFTDHAVVNTFNEDNDITNNLVSLREAIYYLQSGDNKGQTITVKFDYDALLSEAGGYDPANWAFQLDDSFGSLSLAAGNNAGIHKIKIDGSFTDGNGVRQVMTIDGSALTQSVFSIVGMELVLSNITVKGPAASAADGSAAKVTGQGGKLAMNGNVTVTDGNTTGNGTIYVANGGSVTAKGSGNSIQNNTAANGGAVYAANGGRANLNGITIQNNNVTANGGAIYVDGGKVSIAGSTLINNDATADGGAVYVNSGTASMTGSTLSDSNAANGGAIYANGGTVKVSGSTLNNNVATADGGAIYVNGSEVNIAGGTISNSNAVNGGALYMAAGKAELSGTDLASNTATANGGAVYAAGGSFNSSSNTSYTGNSAVDGGALYAENDITANGIYANNKATGGAVIHGKKGVTVKGTVSGNTASGDLILADSGNLVANANMLNNTTSGSVLNAAAGSVRVEGGTIQSTTGAVSVITASDDVVMGGTISNHTTTGPVIDAGRGASVSGRMTGNEAGTVISAGRDVTISGSLIGNTAADSMISATGNVTISGSLSGNEAGNEIVSATGDVKVSGGKVSNNNAGGSVISASSIRVENSFLNGNIAADAVLNALSGDVVMLGSTAADNTGTLISATGDVIALNDTLAYNSGMAIDAAGTAKIVNSIVLGTVNASDVQAAYSVFSESPANLSVDDSNVMNGNEGMLFSGKDGLGHLIIREDSVAAIGVWTAFDPGSGEVYYSTRPEGLWTQGYRAWNMQWNRLGGGQVPYATVSSYLLAGNGDSPSIGAYWGGGFHPDYGPGVNGGLVDPSFNGGFGMFWGYNTVINGYYLNPSSDLTGAQESGMGWYSTLLAELFGVKTQRSQVISVNGGMPAQELDLSVDATSKDFGEFQEAPYRADDGTPLSQEEMNAIRTAAVTGRIPAESIRLNDTVHEQVVSAMRNAELFKDSFDKALDALLGVDA